MKKIIKFLDNIFFNIHAFFIRLLVGKCAIVANIKVGVDGIESESNHAVIFNCKFDGIRPVCKIGNIVKPLLIIKGK